MKSIHFAAGCAAFLLASCSNPEKPVVTTDSAAGTSAVSSRAQKNINAVHVVDKAFETGDVSGIDAVIAPNFVDHTDRGDKNVDSLKAMIKMAHDADKTAKMEVIKDVADDDYVFAMRRYTGTGDGKMMPAGPYDMHAVEVVKFNSDGKATEHWGYMEMSEVAKMMANMPMDKSKMPESAKKK